MKRAIDFVAASLLLLIVSPLFIGTWLVILIAWGRPAFFLQERAGYKKRNFRIYKFRTMTNGRDEKGELLPDEQRLTRLGKFLRMSSLDELPQFINVVKGDMSIIGPRPLPASYIELYEPEYHLRHEMRPGMVCLTSVMGRNRNSWERRFELDVEYVRNWSLWLDFKIALMTIPALFRWGDTQQPGYATSSVFRGKGKG